MIHNCSYCNKPFEAFRKDNQYCSSSCKQLAYFKRRDGFSDDYENTDTLNGKEIEESNGKTNSISFQTVKEESPGVIKSINLSENNDISGYENDESINPNSKTNGLETIQAPDFTILYVPVKCKWIDKIYEQINNRGNERNFCFPKTAYEGRGYQVQWVSIRYRSLLECVLTISEMKLIEWSDMAELTNAFTFLVSTFQFRELPRNYPYTRGITSLRDKLNNFCIETQEEEYVQFSLKFETRKALLMQRYELASSFPRMSFNELQRDFIQANEEQTERRKDEKEENYFYED